MRFGAVIFSAAAMALAAHPAARAAEIDDDVILGALGAEFHISVAASLLPEAPPADRLNAELALPYGRVLLVTECGGPNAFFNPDRREIVLCDERIAAWIAAQGKGT